MLHGQVDELLVVRVLAHGAGARCGRLGMGLRIKSLEHLRRAEAAPQRVRLIDASRTPDEIRAEVEAIIAGVCFQ